MNCVYVNAHKVERERRDKYWSHIGNKNLDMHIPSCNRHIVTVHELWQSKQQFIVVLEFLEGDPLFRQLLSVPGKRSEHFCAKLIESIASALECLHSKGLAHGAVKPSNLIFDSSEPDAVLKLTHIGSKKKKKGRRNSILSESSDILYCPPRDSNSAQGDMWNLGILLYTLLCGYPPFSAELSNPGFDISKASLDFPESSWGHISEHAKSVVQQLLRVQPNKRLTALDLLSNEWIKGDLADTGDFGEKYEDMMTLMEARAQFRKAVRVIICVGRMARMTENPLSLAELTELGRASKPELTDQVTVETGEKRKKKFGLKRQFTFAAKKAAQSVDWTDEQWRKDGLSAVIKNGDFFTVKKSGIFSKRKEAYIRMSPKGNFIMWGKTKYYDEMAVLLSVNKISAVQEGNLLSKKATPDDARSLTIEAGKLKVWLLAKNKSIRDMWVFYLTDVLIDNLSNNPNLPAAGAEKMIKRIASMGTLIQNPES
mmetsp:Transcript_45211/g.88764  ORF Transcript_45211/g.88764 Transcript_45211/m.88764 type:complete len:484 (+) Transcript_45211:2204-3655(+)